MATETAAKLNEKMPTVWSENQKTVQFEELKNGFLVKIEHYNLPQGFDIKTVGMYRGLKETEGVQGAQCLILEVAGDRFIANTAGQLCESRLKEIYLPFVRLIKIVARDHNVVFELFHTLGVCEVELENARKRIEKAQSCLRDISGLNIIGP